MSLLSTLFSLGKSSVEKTDSTAGHPCSNCPSDCSISPGACSECEPYKKRLIDAVYYVENIDAFRARYEVRELTGNDGKITCPFCGGPTSNHEVCDYCGSKLGEASAKILVASASDIPNPIMQAQDIIFERYETVVKKHTVSDSESDSILDRLLAAMTGSEAAEENSPGSKMSEAEINEAALNYGVSVGDYLTGLDNGKYLTLAGYKAAEAQGSNKTEITPVAAGISGVAAVGTLAGVLLSTKGNADFKRPYPGHEDHESTVPEAQGRRPKPSRKAAVLEITDRERDFRPRDPERRTGQGDRTQGGFGSGRQSQGNDPRRDRGSGSRNGDYRRNPGGPGHGGNHR